jgi:hypothetical protein
VLGAELYGYLALSRPESETNELGLCALMVCARGHNTATTFAFGPLPFDDVIAKLNALVADVDAWSRDELAYLVLGLATEAALDEVTPGVGNSML